MRRPLLAIATNLAGLAEVSFRRQSRPDSLSANITAHDPNATSSLIRTAWHSHSSRSQDGSLSGIAPSLFLGGTCNGASSYSESELLRLSAHLRSCVPWRNR